MNEGKSIAVRLAEDASVVKNCMDSVYILATNRRGQISADSGTSVRRNDALFGSRCLWGRDWKGQGEREQEGCED